MATNARWWSAVLGVLVTACGGSRTDPAVAPVASTAAPPVACTARLHDLDLSTWREVAADGFTFCVPHSWSGSGRILRSGTATITWGAGSQPPRRTIAVTRTEVVAGPGAYRPTNPGPPPDSDIRRFSEEIDGRRAELWRNRFGSEYYTGARWSSPRVWIVGDAASPKEADLQVTVYRTVRFDAE